MRQMLLRLTLGIAALGSVSGPAAAAGYNRNAPGIRVVGVGVPAPAPVPDYPARWYFRADIALGIPSDATVREQGIVLGVPPPAGSGTFSTTPGWFTDDNDIYAGYGVGVGYRFTPYFRGDLTVDSRSERQFKTVGADYSYQSPPGTPISGTLTDTTKMHSVATLLNFYYDFHGRRSLVPYVGVGIGFAINELARSSAATESAGGTSFSGREKTHDASLAAMGTVGFTYNIDPSIALDFNYRLLYVGGSEVSMTLNGNTSTLTIGDQIDHQLRAGVRFNVY